MFPIGLLSVGNSRNKGLIMETYNGNESSG